MDGINYGQPPEDKEPQPRAGLRWETVQHLFTTTPNNPPPSNLLLAGELAIEVADPMKLWVGVPTDIDPTGRKMLQLGGAASFPEAPKDGAIYGRQGSNASWQAVLPLYGGTMTGALTIQSFTDATLHLEATGQIWPQITFDTTRNDTDTGYIETRRYGFPRWSIELGNRDPESGSDTGTNFQINRYNDTPGNLIFPTAFKIDRGTGYAHFGSLVFLAANPNSDLEAATKNYVDINSGKNIYLPLTGGTIFPGPLNIEALIDNPRLNITGRAGIGAYTPILTLDIEAATSSPGMIQSQRLGRLRWRITLGDALTPETLGTSVGTNFTITRFDDGGDTLGDILTIIRRTGEVQINTDLSAKAHLFLAADPGSNLEAATRQYVDARDPTNKYLLLTGGDLTGLLTINPVASPPGNDWANLAVGLYLYGQHSVYGPAIGFAGGTGTPNAAYAIKNFSGTLYVSAMPTLFDTSGQFRQQDLSFINRTGAGFFVALQMQASPTSFRAFYNGQIDGTLNMGGVVILPGDPQNDNEAASKHYVDQKTGAFLPLTGGNLTGPLSINWTGFPWAPRAGDQQLLTLVSNSVGAGTQSGIFMVFAGSGAPTITGVAAQGSLSSPVQPLYTQTLMKVAARAWDTAAWSADQAAITLRATEQWSTTAHGTHILFETTPRGVLTPNSWMVYSGKGNLLIGTNDPGQDNLNDKLQVFGTSTFSGYVWLTYYPNADAQAATVQYVKDQVKVVSGYLPLTAGVNFPLTDELYIDGTITGHGAAIHLTTPGWPAVVWNTTTNSVTGGNTAAGYFESQRQGRTRWSVEFGGTEQETGGNQGTNFLINRFDDTGQPIYPSPFAINRQLGTVTINTALMLAGPPTADNQAATRKFVTDQIATGAFLPLAGGVMQGGISWADAWGISPADASKHLTLHSGFGIGISGPTPARMNFITGSTGTFAFINAFDTLTIGAAGITMAANTDVILSRVPTNTSGAVPKSYADLMLPLAGGQMQGGIRFNDSLYTTVSGASDLHNHIQLFSGYGFSITGGTLNIVTGGVTMFSSSSTGQSLAYFHDNGLQMVGLRTIIVGRDPVLGADYEVATKHYVDNIIGASGGPFLPMSAGVGNRLTDMLYMPHRDPTDADMATPLFYVQGQVANLQLQINQLTQNLIFVGQIHIPTDQTLFTEASGLQPDPINPVYLPLPDPLTTTKGYYVIVTVPGIPPVGSHIPMPPPGVSYTEHDWLICDGTVWVHLRLGLVYFTADQIGMNPQVVSGQPLVQGTLQWLYDNTLHIAGGTMVGDLFLSKNPTTDSAAVRRDYVTTTLGGYLALAGGQMQGGITFGQNAGLTSTDTSKHLTLWEASPGAGGYGIGVSTYRQNYMVTSLASHRLIVAGSDVVSVDATGLSMLGTTDIYIPRPPTSDYHAVNRAYVLSRTPLATDAPGDGYSYGRKSATWSRVESVVQLGAGAFDLNAIPTDFIGTYQITNQSGGANWPSDIWVQCAQVIAGYNSTPGWNSQILMAAPPNIGDAAIWFRNAYGGTWSPWWRIMTANGGTFSGAVTFNNGATFSTPINAPGAIFIGGNMNGQVPSPTGGSAIGWNLTAGQGETDFVHRYGGARSFSWWQVTGVGAATQLAWLSPNGDLSVTGNVFLLKGDPTTSTMAATAGYVDKLRSDVVAGYLPLGGGTITGSLTVNQNLAVGTPTASGSRVAVMAATKTQPGYSWYSNTAGGLNQRWYLGLDAYDESINGSNQGAGLALYRYADNGGFLGTVLSFNRADGSANFGYNVYLAHDPSGANPLEAATQGYVANRFASGVTKFNGRTGDVTLLIGDITGAGGAPNDSPFFTGNPRGPTPGTGDNSPSLATTAFVAGGFTPATFQSSGSANYNTLPTTTALRQFGGSTTITGGPFGGGNDSATILTTYRINASWGSQLLIADTGSSGQPGLWFRQQGGTGSWTGTVWHPIITDLGGTLTGRLFLSGVPTADSEAANKAYVDSKAGAYLPLVGGKLTGGLIIEYTATPTSAHLLLIPPFGVGNSLEGKLRFGGTFGVGVGDIGARITASLRSGFASNAWGYEYLDVWINNGNPNDAVSDAQQVQVARFTRYGIQMPANMAVMLWHDPTGDLEAATKQYADGGILRAGGPFLPTAGGEITGYLQVDGIVYSGSNSSVMQAGWGLALTNNMTQGEGEVDFISRYNPYGGFRWYQMLTGNVPRALMQLEPGGNLNIWGAGVRYNGLTHGGNLMGFAWYGGNVETYVDGSFIGGLLTTAGGTLTGDLFIANNHKLGLLDAGGGQVFFIIGGDNHFGLYSTAQNGASSVWIWDFYVRTDASYQHFALPTEFVSNVTFDGQILAKGADPSIRIDGAASTWRTLQYSTAGALRWNIQTTADAETGTGNTGSHYSITRFLDNGSGESVILVRRDTGRVQVQPSNSADPLAIITSSGQPARLRTTISGTRTWSAGTFIDGSYAIGDEDASTFRLQIGTNGLTTINGPMTVLGALAVPNAGLRFGNRTAPSNVATDLSQHISLWDTSYGFSITANTLNVVSGGANIDFYTSSGRVGFFGGNNLTLSFGMFASQITGTATGGGASSAVRAIAGGNATFFWQETGTTANNQKWDAIAGGGSLYFRALTDNESTAASWLSVTRSGGTPTGIAFGAQITSQISINVYTPSWGAFNNGQQLLINGGNNNGLGIADNTGTKWLGIFNSAGSFSFATMPLPSNTTTPPVNLLQLTPTGSQFYGGPTTLASDPTANMHAVTRQWATANLAPISGAGYVSKGGDTMSGALTIRTQPYPSLMFTSFGNAADNRSVQQYVDTDGSFCIQFLNDAFNVGGRFFQATRSGATPGSTNITGALSVTGACNLGDIYGNANVNTGALYLRNPLGILYQQSGNWISYSWDGSWVRVYIDSGFQYQLASIPWVSNNFKSIGAYTPNQAVDYRSSPTFWDLYSDGTFHATNAAASNTFAGPLAANNGFTTNYLVVNGDSYQNNIYVRGGLGLNFQGVYNSGYWYAMGWDGHVDLAINGGHQGQLAFLGDLGGYATYDWVNQNFQIFSGYSGWGFTYAWGGTKIGFEWNGSYLFFHLDGGGGIPLANLYSDRRAKYDIAPSKLDCLATVNALPLSEFRWRPRHKAWEPNNPKWRPPDDDTEPLVRVGIVAQDWLEVFPESIGGTKGRGEAPLATEANVILAALVGSVQQLTAQNTALMARIEALEARTLH